MKIAITGATGFVGGHLTERLLASGHEVVQIARGSTGYGAAFLDHDRTEHVAASVDDESRMREVFADADVDAVAHLAGINIERGEGTYYRVHVVGTHAVVNAAEAAGVDRIVAMSFLRARPDCGSPYHESKWQKEVIVRESDLTHTVLKAGVIYGQGDHMVDHLAKTQSTLPIFGLVGLSPRPVAPVSVHDVVDVLEAALVAGRLEDQTIAVTGPESMQLSEAVKRVATVVDVSPVYIRLPLLLHYLIAAGMELTMEEPITALAQTRILSEGIVEPAPEGICDPLPGDLTPEIRFDQKSIAEALPPSRRFGISDLRSPTDVSRTWRTLVGLIRSEYLWSEQSYPVN